MITYALPDFTNGLQLNLFFAQLQRDNPEVFIDNVRIGSIYGCFPGCIANGGRTQGGQHWSKHHIEALYTTIDEVGLATRLTLTNLLLEKHHLSDEYIQQILTSSKGHAVEIILATDVLNSHLKETYPAVPRILSTTREILDIKEFNKETFRFDYVVLNYQLYRDFDFIESIQQPEKVEVMVNEYCAPDCPRRQHHYVANSRDQLNGEMNMYPCTQDYSEELLEGFMAHAPNHPVRLTTDDVLTLHDDFGISNFKIVGRGMPLPIVLHELIYYLIKPTYAELVKGLIAQLDATQYGHTQ